MNARIVEIAGILKLKRYHTTNIKMEFKHPQYYKNLRKLARLCNRDQAISSCTATAANERAPGTGLKLSDSTMVKQRASSSTSRDQKLQATSKPEPVQVQIASSAKRQAFQPE